MLIEHGADVMAREEEGQTPLHIAVRRGDVEVVCMLIEHDTDSDVTAQDNHGLSPLYLASHDPELEEIAGLLQQEPTRNEELD
jgi:cytohesin